MNQYNFDGRVAVAPETGRSGDRPYTRLVLIRDDYAGQNRDKRTIRIPFVFFGPRAEAVAKYVEVGDQIIISNASVQDDPPREVDGVTVWGYSFIADDWDFGAEGKIKQERRAREKANGGNGGSGN